MNSKKKRAVILGATSLLVERILPSLAEHCERVELVVHSNIPKGKYLLSSLALEGSVQPIKSFALPAGSPVDLVLLAQSSPVELKPFIKRPWTDYQKHFEAQVGSTYTLLRALEKNLSKPSLVISVSSSFVVTDRGVGLMSDYMVAKYALEGLIKGLSAEWKTKGVQFLSLYPEYYRSSLNKNWPSVPPYDQDGSDSLLRAQNQIIHAVCEFIAYNK